MPTILHTLRKKRAKNDHANLDELKVVATSYTSVPVALPDTFLAPLPSPDSITTSRIVFAGTRLAEYDGLYARVLDGVLSRGECAQLLEYAEQSAGAPGQLDPRAEGGLAVVNRGWKPAMVNAGIGHEYMARDYRNSERIIWDSTTVMDRLWARVLQCETVRAELELLTPETDVGRAVMGERKCVMQERWRVVGLNERGRYLRYERGGYFRSRSESWKRNAGCADEDLGHCDGRYQSPEGNESFLTLHLYLNDSVQELSKIRHERQLSADAPLEATAEVCDGGATTFHTLKDKDATMDIDPLAGRVLIFQHRRLLHSGAELRAGVKYTLRTDIMYEFAEVEGDDVVFGE